MNDNVKIKKKFMYNDIEIQIIERDEPYMNSEKPLRMTRVIAPNGKILPIQIQRGWTLKKIVSESVAMIDGFIKRGADIKELTK